MLNSLLIAVGAIVSMMIIWIGVQSIWGKTFSEYLIDEDVMAGRTKCGNCGCTTACKNDMKKVSSK
jgi:hypothetical protein